MLLARNASTNAGNLRGAQPEREKYAGKGVDKWECGLGSIANAGFYSNLSMEEAASANPGGAAGGKFPCARAMSQGAQGVLGACLARV